MPLITRVAARRNSGRSSLAPFIALLPTTMSQSRVAQVLERAAVEVEIAEVDLLADHPGAARLEDAAAQRLAVVRLAERERADLGQLGGEVLRRARRCGRVEPFSARITSNASSGASSAVRTTVEPVEQLGRPPRGGCPPRCRPGSRSRRRARTSSRLLTHGPAFALRDEPLALAGGHHQDVIAHAALASRARPASARARRAARTTARTRRGGSARAAARADPRTRTARRAATCAAPGTRSAGTRRSAAARCRARTARRCARSPRSSRCRRTGTRSARRPRTT